MLKYVLYKKLTNRIACFNVKLNCFFTYKIFLLACKHLKAYTS